MWVILVLLGCVAATSIAKNGSTTDTTVTPDCGTNAYYEVCAPPPNRSQNCSSLWTDASPSTNKPDDCCEARCMCNKDYLRDDDTGECLAIVQCLDKPNRPCGKNEIKDPCRRACPPDSCEALYLNYLCAQETGCTPGCVCDKNHLRDNSGYCIPTEECPPSPYLESFPGRPKSPTTTAAPETQPPKNKQKSSQSSSSSQSQSSSHSSQSSSSSSSQSVSSSSSKKSSGNGKLLKCGHNEKAVKCKQICPPQSCDISYTDYACDSTQPCIAGCDCIKNHLRNSTGQCIFNDDCPPPPTAAPPTQQCGPDEYFDECPRQCPPHICSSIWSRYDCRKFDESCKPECRCKDGKLRDDQTGECLTVDECIHAPKCGLNEKRVKCKTVCPPQSCAISYTTYSCTDPQPCEAGCDCIDNYLRDYNGTCVLNDNCPPPPTVTPPTQECGPDEYYDKCPQQCPSLNCSSLWSKFDCTKVDQSCQPGCVCKDNKLRNDQTGECLTTEECINPPQCGINEKRVKCRTICPPQSCDISYTTYSCQDPQPCEAGCDCIENYLRDGNGTCVLNDECPPPSPVTVSPGPEITTTPSPNECSVNQTHVMCNFGCPNLNCPTHDSRAILACSPPYPCPEGCACNKGYKRVSSSDNACILAQDCPPVNCTRLNEEWSACPSCASELAYCKGVQPLRPLPISCNDADKICNPQCVCKPGFFRNSTDDCVSADQCPPSEPEVTTPSPEQTTLRPESTCTGLNERFDNCSSLCLLENCRDRNTACNELLPSCVPKCVCNKDFYRNDSNICVPEAECPSEETTSTTSTTTATPEIQCAQDEIPADCGFECPYNFCPDDDSLVKYACKPPRDCKPGCKCKLNYRRKSYTDRTCVPAAKCPPVDCTRANEKWNGCPSPCLDESCASANTKPTTCEYLVENCDPRCVCKEGHFRNDTEICVPKSKCPTIKS